MADKKFKLRDIMNALEAEKGEKKGLSDIDDDFFTEIRDYLNDLKKMLHEQEDFTSKDAERLRRKYLEAKRMSEKLFILRVRKVALASVHKFSGAEGVDTDFMTDKEMEFFNDVRGLLKNMKDEVLYGIYRRNTSEDDTSEDDTEPDLVEEDTPTVEYMPLKENSGKGEILIHVTDDVPSFVDQEVTHHLKREDVVTLKEELANVLISRGMARKVDLS